MNNMWTTLQDISKPLDGYASFEDQHVNWQLAEQRLAELKTSDKWVDYRSGMKVTRELCNALAVQKNLTTKAMGLCPPKDALGREWDEGAGNLCIRMSGWYSLPDQKRTPYFYR